MLTPHIDRLFDDGLISFKADGEVLISKRFCKIDADRLGVQDALHKGCGGFTDAQAHYLNFHQTYVFW